MLELDRLNEAFLSQVVRTVRFRNFPGAVLLTVTKTVIVNIASAIVVNLSDAGGIRSGEVVALSQSFPTILDGKYTGFTRTGSSQYGGAGEGEVQHARVGEEVEQPLHVPGVVPRGVHHLGQGQFGVILKVVVDVIIKCIFLAHGNGWVLDLAHLLIYNGFL